MDFVITTVRIVNENQRVAINVVMLKKLTQKGYKHYQKETHQNQQKSFSSHKLCISQLTRCLAAVGLNGLSILRSLNTLKHLGV